MGMCSLDYILSSCKMESQKICACCLASASKAFQGLDTVPCCSNLLNNNQTKWPCMEGALVKHCSTTQLCVTCCKNFLQQTTYRLQWNQHMHECSRCYGGTTKPTSVTSRALMHMLILLQSVCRLLEEVLATCDTKMSGATVIRSPGHQM